MKNQEDIYKIPVMEFEQGSIGYLEKIFAAQLILMSKPNIIIETGTFNGQTTKFLSKFLNINKMAGHIYSFDLPDVIENLMSRDSFFDTAENVHFIKGSLPDTLEEFLSKKNINIDFAVIDSEHTYKQVKLELNVIEKYLRDGAYVFCHDYLENDDKYNGVVKAVKEFSDSKNYEMIALSGSKIWGTAILRKPLV